jgi:hypothetical protein
MQFLEFTAGELPVSFCRSALQARIVAESRSYSKTFCNDRVKKESGIEPVSQVTELKLERL